jgi:hypothetical protein
MLRKRVRDLVGNRVAEGPAVRRRSARHATQAVGVRSADVWRGDDGPRGPIPALDEGLRRAVLDVSSFAAPVCAKEDRSTRQRDIARTPDALVFID